MKEWRYYAIARGFDFTVLSAAYVAKASAQNLSSWVSVGWLKSR